MIITEAREVAKKIISDVENFLLEKYPTLIFGYENADITLCLPCGKNHIEPIFNDDLEPYLELIRKQFPQYHWHIAESLDYHDPGGWGIDLLVRKTRVDRDVYKKWNWDGRIELRNEWDDDVDVEFVWEDA